MGKRKQKIRIKEKTLPLWFEKGGERKLWIKETGGRGGLIVNVNWREVMGLQEKEIGFRSPITRNSKS